jgi:dTDP-4-dehydrorhamnose reductase
VPRILVLGETGQLARSLGGLRWPAGCDLVFAGRRHLPGDAPASGLRALLEASKPALVLNTAAYTAVDRAESEPQAAAALNADLPRALAETCGARDIPLVHVSTDYVFDGEKHAPYLETDTPNPLSVYGATKLEGDRAIERTAPRRWAILRTSWVVSDIGETFPVKLLRRAGAGESLRVVDDQWGCPTAASELARAMQGVALRLLDGDLGASALFNFCGSSEMSWHGLAEKLLAAAESRGLKRAPLQAITTTELKAPARRPAYSVLSCQRIEQACGLSAAAIESDLDRMVMSILES